MGNESELNGLGQFTDEDFRKTMLAALRLLGILAAIAAALIWLKLGWRSAAMLLVGAAISASGLWEWLRLMTAVMLQMDAGPGGSAKATPLARVLLGFFLRLGLAVVLLYVSLKVLNGSVYALAAGLGLGVLCLSIEAMRMMKARTV